MPSRQQPSKLFNLREWLTLDEAAKYLAIIFGEEITRADVLRLALDGCLTLSVDFVNHARVRKGRIFPLEECPLMAFKPTEAQFAPTVKRISPARWGAADPSMLVDEIREKIKSGALTLSASVIHYRPNQYVVLEDEVTSIGGIWDLPLIGAERLDVEHLYQMETKGPNVTLTNLNGVFVERNGVVCQLQEYSGDPMSAVSELHSYPSGSLPNDAVYVVRTAALREFEQDVLGEDQRAKDRPGKREESTFLNIIGAMLGLMLGKTPAGKPQSVYKSQSSVIDALLASYGEKAGISERTLQDKFAAAKQSLQL